MKKAISLLLVFVFTLSGLTLVGDAASSGLLDSEIESFSINTDGSYTTEFKTDNSDAVKALTEVLNQVISISEAPTAAVIQAKISAKLKNGKTSDFEFFTHDKILHIRKGSKVVQVEEKSWADFTKAVGSSFYKYSRIPTLSFDDTSVVASESTYAYKKIDFLFYRPTVASNIETPTIKSASKASFSLEPSSVSVTATNNSKSTSFESLSEFSKFAPSSGTYDVKITAKYSNSNYRGDVVYKVKVNYGGSSASSASTGNVEFSVKGASTYPGEVAVIRISGVPEGEKIKYSGNLSDVPNFFKESTGNYIALLPINYRSDTGDYTINLSVGDKSQGFKIVVNNKQFQIQYLTADSTTTANTLNSEKANNEFEEKIAPIRYTTDNKAYWKDGGFIWPTNGGKVTTQFGMIRYVNGQPTSYRHGAIDFALPKGTRVGSTANGRVLYSGFLQLTGNTVVIEHGYGLKSWYYHMDSRNVSTGDLVTLNQKIGEVGTTGFSTGNHLHFGFSVNNVFINPTTIIESDLLY